MTRTRRHIFRMLLCLAALTLGTAGATAQEQREESVSVTVRDSLGVARTESIELPPSMTYPIDSLLAEWKVKTFISTNEECSTSNDNPLFSDSIYIDRLSRMPTVIEMPYNEIVREFIDQYTVRRRSSVSLMLSLCNFYIPIFEEALNAYNLPLELRYLPIIESALNPRASSRAGAKGLWQFMPATGKLYGLENNSLVDDRQDPIKSSWAAARYLKDMYDIYHDWTLVIAAYNCGPGNINKAISRSGGKTDYWAIYNYLPRETRGYVPSFIAANYVMTYYCKHNICPMDMEIPSATDTVVVNRNIHLRQIAEVCNVDYEELRSLNPQYKRDIIPGDTGPQTLCLPQDLVGIFLERQDSVAAYKATEYFRNRRVVAVPEQSTRSSRNRQSNTGSSSSSGSSSGATYHTIRRGETLSTIAQRYGTTVSRLRSLNGISGSSITAGKKLRVK